MKKIIPLFFLGMLVLHTNIAKAQQQGVIMMKMLGLKTALLNKDSISLSNLLADDVTYGHSNGWLQTKAQLIRDVVSGVQDYKTIEPSSINIRVYENAAVVTLESKSSMVFQGKPLELSMNILLIWVMKDNDWKLEARQSVKNN